MAEKLTQQQIDKALGGLPGWSYDGQRAISKKFEYPDHIAAFGFLTKVAMAAEAMDHHPEVEMVYNKVTLTLSTHTANGVTQNDIDLATKAEQYA
jgi:4a-hydroxytetrahydrobiopterin dehydratase